MIIHPHPGGQIASDRQREMLATAERQRLVRRLRAEARASRPAGRTVRRLREVLRNVTARRTEIPT
jgi:hypothetical protein